LARYLVSGEPDFGPLKLLPSAEGSNMPGKSPSAGPQPTARWSPVDIKTRSYVEHNADDDTFLETAWHDAKQALPVLAGLEVKDRVLTRNDIALCRRPAGFARRLQAFQQQPPPRGVAFAGDYLINSTVGRAHLSGLRAAHRLLDQPVPAST